MTRAPVRVAVIDLARPFVDLDCARVGSAPYRSAWILACSGGRPLATVEVPVEGSRITAAELTRALAHLGPRGSHEAAVGPPLPLPSATVVVPTAFARPVELFRCVERLKALDHPDYEVIVVDNRAKNARPLALDGVRVVHELQPGISAARNRGLSEAAGEIVAFTDDDVEVDDRWLRAIGERFAHQPELAAVAGLVVPRELETPAQIWFEQSGSGLDRNFAPLTFELAPRFRLRRRNMQDGSERLGSLYATGELGLGSNMAFRAAVLRAAGGFDEALGVGTPSCGGEDLAIFLELLTAGHRLGYEPGAMVFHQHRATFDELARQLRGYGIGFTAMLTAITLRDPRHLIGLLAVLPAWLRSLRDPASAKHVHRQADYPRSLARAELLGMLAGPFAYLASRRASGRWSP